MRLDQAIANLSRKLETAGIETASLDARLLVQHALGLDDTGMLLQFDKILDEQELRALAQLAVRRLDREPVAHILGYREFWGLPFKVTPDTLVPRPDSETLVEAVLSHIKDRNAPQTLADIGTGTGCLLLSLLNECPGMFGVGVDISQNAIQVAQLNASKLGLDKRCRFIRGDYASALGEGIDILISNPPYLAANEMDDLERDVARYDPYSALVSGQTGLEAYEAIFRKVRSWRALPGLMAFEIGYRQATDLVDLATKVGLPKPSIIRDLGRNDRVLLFTSEQ